MTTTALRSGPLVRAPRPEWVVFVAGQKIRCPHPLRKADGGKCRSSLGIVQPGCTVKVRVTHEKATTDEAHFVHCCRRCHGFSEVLVEGTPPAVSRVA
jgi:hypothetical protein